MDLHLDTDAAESESSTNLCGSIGNFFPLSFNPVHHKQGQAKAKKELNETGAFLGFCIGDG